MKSLFSPDDFLKNKDADSFKGLFYEFYKPLCRFVYKVLNDEQVSEDIVQDVFINIWEKRQTLNIKSSFKSYLFQSCYNAAINYYKKKQRESNKEDKVDGSAEQKDPELLMITTEQEMAFMAALSSLPEVCRKVFLMRREEGLSNKEISIKLNISVKTVENHMTRAINGLKQKFL